MRFGRNTICRFGILLTVLLPLLVGCRGSQETTQPGTAIWILEVHPNDKTSVLPDVFEIYVLVEYEPDLSNMKFLVWKEGQPLGGRIGVEKHARFYKIKYDVFDKSEGTYLAYFSYGNRVTVWTFFVEITRPMPMFDRFSIPRDGHKNFPHGIPVVLSEEKILNFMTIDDETVRLRKRFLFERREVPFDVSFVPNRIIVNLEGYESSANYELEVTGVMFLEGNPGSYHSKLSFRTQDIDRPFIRACSPDFCVRKGDCSTVDSLRNFEIIFGDDEEIDPFSVLENLVIEIDGRSVVFGEVWHVMFDRHELILRNPDGTAKLYVFPNKIFVDFSEDLRNQRISIFVLPRLSDSSGNAVDRFFSWCIKVGQ